MKANGPQALHQWAYDYLWDRWGLYLGTFRTFLIVLGFSDSILLPVYRLLVLGDVPLWFVIARNLISFAIIWFFFARDHLGEEWKLQDEGRFETLNAKTLEMSWVYGLIRFLIVLFLVLEVDFATQGPHVVVAKVVAAGFMLSWTFACGVLVREREPDRFARTAPQGA